MVFIWEDNIKNKVIAYAKNDSAAAAAKSLQSCPTLCNSIDGSPPGSAIPGILQARTLEWVDTPFRNEKKISKVSAAVLQKQAAKYPLGGPR